MTDSKRISGILIGLILSVIISASLVIAAAKAGIVPGVSPLVVLFVWMVFGAVIKSRFKEFIALVQVTGSGGAAVTAGVVFIAPIVQILISELGGEVPPVDIPMMILAAVSGSFLGWGAVGLATKRFLTDPKLPAPEAVACDRMIQAAVENPNQRPPILTSLIPGLLFGFMISLLINFKFIAKKLVAIPLGFGIALPVAVAPVYIGIGALLTLPTAILVFSGGLVNAITQAYAASAGMPGTTFRWVGGAAMTVAVAYSLIQYWFEGRKTEATADTGEFDMSLLEIDKPMKNMLLGSMGLGSVLLFVMMFMSGASITTLVVMGIVALLLTFFLSGLGGLLSLQVGSSASPVSGTVFMGMLVLSLTALVIGLEGVNGVMFLVPITVAACVAICAANDSSQDYKTMQFNGLKVSSGFVGQLVGLLGGAIIVPIVLWVAHESYVLGSADLPAPQASFFATVLKSLFLQSDIPWGPVMAGAGVGVVAVIVEIIGRRKGMLLSSLAMAVGIYLPSVIGTGMLIGAAFRYFGVKSVNNTTHTGILNAAGLITGDAIFSLILGVCIIAGTDLTSFNAQTGFGVVGSAVFFLLTVGFIYYNYNSKRTQ